MENGYRQEDGGKKEIGEESDKKMNKESRIKKRTR